MRLLQSRFNNYFLPTLLLALALGCASTEEKQKREEASTLRLYMESDEESNEKSTLVPIVRSNPIVVRIAKDPFMDEGSITEASLVDVMGGFAIEVKFDFHGTLVLENATMTYRGRRVAIYSMFTEGRWLAAPQLNRRITDGVITFTPDATRQEAERIVRGLNNVASKLGNKPKPGKEKTP